MRKEALFLLSSRQSPYPSVISLFLAFALGLPPASGVVFLLFFQLLAEAMAWIGQGRVKELSPKERITGGLLLGASLWAGAVFVRQLAPSLNGRMMGLLLLVALPFVLRACRLWRKPKGEPLPIKTIKQFEKKMKNAASYREFQWISGVILVAAQGSLALLYPVMRIGSEMVFFAGTWLLLVWTGAYLWVVKRKKAPGALVLLGGLLCWGGGMGILGLAGTKALFRWGGLGLAAAGMGLCLACRKRLEVQMAWVAKLVGDGFGTEYKRLRIKAREAALFFGAALGLCLWVYAGEGKLFFFALWLFLLLLATVILCLSWFPMSRRYTRKLERLLVLREAGEKNESLERQVKEIFLEKHPNRWGIRVIIFLWRLCYPHRVVGAENAKGYEDTALIIVSNHGEMYGPIVTNLFMPIPFRPWAIGKIMDKDALVEHIYQGTMVRQKWLPESWKKPLVRVLGVLLTWVMKSLEGIPVYRGTSRELMQTFRLSIEALEGMDQILLFPESGENDGLGGRGYAEEGFGKIFTGFITLAPMYYAKTRQKVVFLPVYGDKRNRTLRIGEGICFDPNAPSAEEKERIAAEVEARINALYFQGQRT